MRSGRIAAGRTPDPPGWSDGDGDRATRGVVRGIGTGHAATARVPPTDRVEVEERLTGGRQATAAGRARDRAIASITDRGGRADLGIGRMDHVTPSGASAGLGKLGPAHPRVTLPHVRRTVRVPGARCRHRNGNDGVAVRLRCVRSFPARQGHHRSPTFSPPAARPSVGPPAAERTGGQPPAQPPRVVGAAPHPP